MGPIDILAIAGRMPQVALGVAVCTLVVWALLIAIADSAPTVTALWGRLTDEPLTRDALDVEQRRQ